MLELGCDFGDAPCELANLSLGAVVCELAARDWQIAGRAGLVAVAARAGSGSRVCRRAMCSMAW